MIERGDRMSKRGLTTAAICVILLAGCAAQDRTAEPAGASRSARADATLLQSIRDAGDIVVTHSSPAARAAEVPVAFTGTVAGMSPGRTLVRGGGAAGFEVREETVVVRVRIDRVLKADGVPLGKETAFVSLRRGSQATDPTGKRLGDGPSTITSVDEFLAAVPVGSRVVVLAAPVPAPTPGEGVAVLNPDVGSDRGVPLLEGNPPQAFAVEDGRTGRLSGWEPLTYAEAVAGLEDALS